MVPIWTALVVAQGLPCTPVAPLLVVYNRLPWFKSKEWGDLVGNRSTAFEHQYTAPEKDVYTLKSAMNDGDSVSSHGDALRVARTIREIQQRSVPRQRQRLILLERSFSYLEVPEIPQGRVAWVNIVEDPVERAARAWKGTPAELDRCVETKGAAACVPCDTMTGWFCGGGPMCATASRGLAALVRAKLVLVRDYAFVAVKERWLDSLLVLDKVLPSYFSGAAAAHISKHGKSRQRLDADEPLPSATLKPETRRKIREANSLDVELYAHAVAHLDIIAYACLGRPSLSGKMSVGLAHAETKRDDDDAAVNFDAPQPSLESLVRLVVPPPAPGLAGQCVKRQHLHSANKVVSSDSQPRSDDPPADSYCFPSAVGVGASRAGTGLVSALLNEHPHVRVPDHTLAYFGRALKRGRRGLASYVRNFPVADRDRARAIAFEASPDYSLHLKSLREIKTLLGPAVNIVFALREPTARAYDDFWKYARAGRLYQRERELFLCYEHAFGVASEADEDKARRRLQNQPTRQQRSLQMCASRGQRVAPRAVSPLVFDAYARQVIMDAWEPELRSVAKRASFNDSLPLNFELGELNDNILCKSFYAPQITRLLATFPTNNIHFLVYEHLISSTRGPHTLEALAAFLKVPKHAYSADLISNIQATLHEGGLSNKKNNSPTDGGPKAKENYPPILRKTRRLLEAFYTVDAELLKRMLPNLELPW